MIWLLLLLLLYLCCMQMVFLLDGRYSRRNESTGRPYEPTNTILDSQSGDAPREYATTAINRSRREHDLNETTLQARTRRTGGSF